MKAKIILAIMWISICLCERQQRSTVLTDESKRVLEQFDFSNFDKQEALNYIDRQRFENQIRGKRSHSRIKKEQNDEDENPSDEEPESNEQKKEENNESYNFDSNPEMFENYPPDPREPVSESQVEPITTTTAKSKKGHRSKKKHRSKIEEEKEEEREEKEDREEREESDEEEEGESTYRPRKKKKKKKKKKKRHYWDNWTEWSPCSVTCGRGRRIRWRKCIVKNCTTGDLEMGEKTCQLPACNLLTKLLGL